MWKGNLMRKKYFTCLDSSEKYGDSLEEAVCKLKSEVSVKKMVGEDVLTAVSRRIAYKNHSYIRGEKEKTGLIFVTEYGNLTTMLDMCRKAMGGEYVSTKMFPNAIVSSASNATALLLETKGFNLTINGGYLGYVMALELAAMYIDTGELDTCVIMSGDHYNDFSERDVMQQYPSVKKFESKVTISVMSVYQNNSKQYILEDIEVNEHEESSLMAVYNGDMLWTTNYDSQYKELIDIYNASSFSYNILKEAMDYNMEFIDVSFGRKDNVVYRTKLRRIS